MTKDLMNVCSYILELKPNTSNLVLQKLLYFVQAGSLVYLEKEAFMEDIQAWQYGPVVQEAYQTFKYNNDEFHAEVSEDFKNSILGKLIKEIVESLGNKRPFYLVDLTHSYISWKEAWRNPLDSEITKESILNCHKKLAKDNDGFIF